MTEKTITPTDLQDEERRDFLTTVTVATGAAGAACACYPLIKSMSPSATVKAQKYTEVNLASMSPGDSKIEMWQGKPVFIKRRTAEDISKAKAENDKAVIDPQTDADRVKKEEWLVHLLVCTHLGCTPNIGGDVQGGWLCPCHGSQFDSSGRVRRGPAGKNLEVPPYTFIDDNTIKIG